MTTIWGIAHREIGKRTAASWVDERVFGTFAEAYMAASVLRAAETEYEKHLSGDHGKYVRREFTVLLRWGDEPVWPTQAVDDAAIEILKSEVALLVRRGDVTWPEVLGLRCNSDEWNAIIVRMGDEAFFRKIRHTLANCSPPKHKGATYDEHLVAVYVPELIRRWSVRVSMELRAKCHDGAVIPFKVLDEMFRRMDCCLGRER